MQTAQNQTLERELPLLQELGQSDSERQESLIAAFKAFSQTSEQLSRSYKMLEKRVASLTAELDQVSAEREEESREKRQIAYQMQALLDFLPGGVIVLDSRGIVTQANPASEYLLQTKLEGRVWRKIIGECFAPRNDDGLEVSTKSGKRISVATSSLDGNGQIILLTDQTETRELQHKLSRHEKLSAMGKMVSALAHQIRTPLSAALLYAGHICNESLEEQKRQQFSQKILSRLQHMEKQVRDMMLFVKSELPLNDVITSLQLEKGLKEAIEASLGTHGVQVAWINAVPEARIKCHREALISALVNLVDNALQAAGQTPEISIALTSLSPGSISVMVEDNGVGIPEEMIQEVQEMFVTTKKQGTGIGLAVVQAVARAHGGRFELNSQLGDGTVASIHLPQSNIAA
ncbi:sensor histidine kinase [Teredinibacter sp. KSP-S5-2]|uniref:sensor histidine kinase n=1 Tax=Teredinibacter sp. KSP-S5-2 TaxID=3034506 RepID=UPI002934522C|nr:ATP-binding protein [Teredinibacter sp. KSP-S5-2]WNO07936.1 ATP-binding protein [Teredinibacter sp. KSP-S5-2]